MNMSTVARLVVLYGNGGLSDVGRHAVQAALERDDVAHVQVLTEHPELLNEPNWACGCSSAHSFSAEDKKRFTVAKVNSWNADELSKYFKDATAVVSCLGNRQPFVGHWVAFEGNNAVVHAMKEEKVARAVVLSSVGVEEDWPPLEFHFAGKVLAFLFLTFARSSFRDLTKMEQIYKGSDLDYLFVRPVGIGEEVVPIGSWCVQKEKYKDSVGLNMAKLDVARFMIEEALHPTRHRTALVVGGKLEGAGW
jgi:hypothetical protein